MLNLSIVIIDKQNIVLPVFHNQTETNLVHNFEIYLRYFSVKFIETSIEGRNFRGCGKECRRCISKWSRINPKTIVKTLMTDLEQSRG